MDSAWRGVVVEESNLAVQISSIRGTFLHRFRAANGGWRRLRGADIGLSGPSRGCAMAYHWNAAACDPARESSRAADVLCRPQARIGRAQEAVGEADACWPSWAQETSATPAGAGTRQQRPRTSIADGVWFVDLAPLGDPDLVPNAAAQALGVQQSPGKPVVEALCSQCQRAAAVADIRQLRARLRRFGAIDRSDTASGSQPSIIATSREPLGVTGGEQILPSPDALVAGSDSDGWSRSGSRKRSSDLSTAPSIIYPSSR